jgi:hypothetical protein
VRPQGLLALALLAALSACPYQADAPLSQDRSVVDDRLLGAWVCETGGEKPGTVTISGPSEGLYTALLEGDDEPAEPMAMFITTVGTQRILNVKDDEHWLFVRYTAAEKDRITFELADEKAFDGKRSDHDVVAAAETGSVVFEDLLACTRKP